MEVTMKVLIDQDLNVQVLLGDVNSLGNMIVSEEYTTSEVTVSSDGGDYSGGNVGGEEFGGMMGSTTTAKDPLLSNWPFVIGISLVTLALSIVLGFLLAKRKIKKGFELYED